ncbi:MAG TPA: DUF420 domain-containing protein [Myxococcota bacterium]|nr:DUF420 domain-containing protein [Myxococcota bacterium]
MDPRLVYWSAAFANMVVIVALALVGVASARRGAIARHRRCMLAASVLVGLFVVSYVVKLAVLGREALSTWDPAAVWTLRVHELCVFTMLAAGATAGLRAWRLRAAPLAPEHAIVRGAHRRAGWTAVAAACLGVATAAAVLAGMYARAG